MGLFQSLFGTGNAYSESRPEYYNHDFEQQKRLERYKKTWEAYLAELPDPITQDSAVNDNVKINPARAVINTGVYFLFGNELKFQVSPDASERFGNGEATDSTEPNQEDTVPDYLAALNKAWKANRKRSLLFNLGLSGAIHGTPFVKIVPNGAGMNNEFPRLLLLDPANVDVEWDPNDHEKVIKFCIQYITEREDINGNVEPILIIQEITAVQDANKVIQSWTMQDYEQPMNFVPGTGFLPDQEEKVPVGPETEWPYAWPPIDYCQNVELPHMFWGLPDLDEASVEVIESIQRSMSSMNKIVRIHAAPRMYAKNVMPDQIEEIDVSADNIITLPNMDADLNVLQTLGQLGQSIEYAEEQRKMLLEMIQVPPIALGDFDSASTAISGVTLSILYAPLLQKTELKRISYGDMLDRLNIKMLTLMGFDPTDYEDNVVLVWPEAMPGSAYLERQTLQQDQQMGASNYTILSRLGYDPQEERMHFLQEQEQLLKLQQEYAPPTGPFGDGPGGNNNPAGNGNKNGSLGGTKAAGVNKTPSTGTTPTS